MIPANATPTVALFEPFSFFCSHAMAESAAGAIAIDTARRIGFKKDSMAMNPA